MDASAVIAAIDAALKLVPILIQLGEDVSGYITTLRAVASGVGLTDAQRTTLNANINAAHSAVQASAEDEK